MTLIVRKVNIKMITIINGEKPNSFLKVLLGDCYKPINLEFSYNSNLAFFEKLISITYKEFLNTEKGDMNLRFFLKKRIDYYKKYERSYFLEYFKNKSNIDFYNFIIKESNEKMLSLGVPEVVVRKFNEWNSGRNEYILSAISDIDSSNVFSTVVEKQYTVLSTYVNSSNFILMDAEKTLKSLNGDLTGTTYKGKKVESLHG